MQRRPFRICACPIEGSVRDLRIVSIEITLWLLLAGITMSLSGCSGGSHRVYNYEGHRYRETRSGGAWLTGPGGQVTNATSVVSKDRPASLTSSDDGASVGNEGGKPEPPDHEVQTASETRLSPTVGDQAAGLSEPASEIVTETPGCRPFPLSITMASWKGPHVEKRSCWNLLWDIPAGLLLDAFVASLIASYVVLRLSTLGA